MSTKVVQENASEKIEFAQKINILLLKNRVVLITAIAVVFCGFIAFAAITTVVEKKRQKAFESVETVLSDWEKARSAKDTTGLAETEDELIKTLQAVFHSNKNSYAGAHAANTIAEIYFLRKDWKNAQDNYLAAAKAAPKAYSNGINYFNAAVCSDELGNQEEAIEYYSKAVEADGFLLKPRALFNIGRVQEQLSRKEEALATYEKLAEQYPNDEWTLLAKSRTIALQIEK